jgi:hypothetical protein
MQQSTTAQPNEIKKVKLKEVVLFALNNIPQADATTLKQFLELANAGGTFGTISHRQILKNMRQVLKYVPGASVRSLMILLDLLEIEPVDESVLDAPPAERWNADPNEAGPAALLIDLAEVMPSSDYARANQRRMSST